jgi:molecular chaperone GrpE
MSDERPSRWDERLTMLEDLASWLRQTQEWATGAGTAPSTAAEEQAPETAVAAGGSAQTRADLELLLRELTALRHDVKVQNRSAHQDRERAAAALGRLSEALSRLDEERARENERREALRAEVEKEDLELLVDLHDALSNSLRRAEGAFRQLSAGLRAATEPPPAAARRSHRFAWLRSGPPPGTEPERLTADAIAVAGQLESMLDGFRLSVERLERGLTRFGVEPVAAVGAPVDPEEMEVVQVAFDPNQQSHVVLDEVRRGYRRHGRVYRYAQVVANQAPAAPLARS